MMTLEEAQHVERNANCFDPNSFGFAHYRRPDMVLAQLRGGHFTQESRFDGKKMDKWIVGSTSRAIVAQAQRDLAAYYTADSWWDLIRYWHELEKFQGFAFRIGQHQEAHAL